MSVSTNDNGVRPIFYYSGDIVTNDSFSEYSSIKNVSNGSVRRLPHLFKFKLFNSFLIWGDGCTFNADLMLFNGMGSIDCHLVISLVSVFHSQVVIFDIDIQIRLDVL